MEKERYRNALAYIHSFITGPAVLPGLSREERLARMRAIPPRMRYFLRVLGEPHRRYHTLHVGGTSGKGSTAKMLAAILQAAGHKTGLHTTPYLQEPLEKLVVDGRCISPAALADLVEACKPAIETAREESPFGPPIYGELWLALALSYFASDQVDFAVVEVRKGGRYDCTNLVEPLVSVITGVNFDHVVTLGGTLAEIAWHKAGIIKKGIPAVTAASQPEVLEVLRTECERQGALLLQVGKDTRYEVRRLNLDGGFFDFYGIGETRWQNIHVAMLGEHQIANAATALTALQALRRFGRIDVSEQAVRAGLEQARFPGRLEIVQRRPLVVLDGAHNPEKMEKLRIALETLFSYERLILVIGVIAAKDFASIVSRIAPIADRIVTTAPRVFGKDPVSPDEMARFVCENGFPRSKVVCEPDPLRAVERALAMSGPDDLVCITGSLYLLGEVREIWQPTDHLFFGANDGGSDLGCDY
jgi:dihydrofolate synthase/folylpolyglutamate synthase